MTESVPPQHGRVVWHDLMTTDLGRAKEFYSQLFGWNLKRVDMGPAGNYDMINASECDIGGMVPLEVEKGLPSHWIAYVNVDDVDAAAKTAAAEGGQTHVPPTDIPNVGRFAVISGPEGGYISAFKHVSGESMPEHSGPPTPGHFCWEELLTTDADKSREFYPKVFGWATNNIDMGPMGTYTLLNRGEVEEGGMMQMPAEAEAPSHWLPYVAVEDVDATAARVTELGGTVYKAPDDIPNVGRFAVCGDPTGATFALYKPAG